MKLYLQCHAARSGNGVSIPVTLLAIDDDYPLRQPERRLVKVRLPDGYVDSFQVRELSFENYDAFDVTVAVAWLAKQEVST